MSLTEEVCSDDCKLDEIEIKRNTSYLSTAPLPSVAQRNVAGLLRNSMFDMGMGMIIMFNMAVIVIETDDRADSEVVHASWTNIAGWSMLAIFIVELNLRLFAYRSYFWEDPWSRFDFVVVVTDAILSLFGLLLGGKLNVSTLRIFRLCKLARASHVVRLFPELRMMVGGLIGSMKTIFWGVVLLSFVIVVCAIVAVQLIHPVNQDLSETGVYRDCDRCPRAYSTVAQACLTFAQGIVAGDAWGTATIPLIEYQPATALYFFVVYVTVGMAVINLILGVVVNVAQGEHEKLKSEIETQRRVEKMEMQKHLLDICRQMDTDGSGEVSKEELIAGFRDRSDFRESILSMDLDKDDLEILWTILDVQSSGKVSYHEFVEQVYKMRNSDTQWMIAYTKYYVTILKDTIIGHIEQESDVVTNAVSNVQEEVARIDVTELEQAALIKQVLLDDGDAEKNVKDDGQEPSSCTNKDRRAQGSGQSIDDKPADVENPQKAMNGDCFSGQLHAWKVVMDDSRRLQSDLRNTMQDIQRGLELHISNTSKLLLEVLPPQPKHELMTLPSRASHAGSPWAIPMCCKQGSPVETLTLPHNDFVIPSSPGTAVASNSLSSYSIQHGISWSLGVPEATRPRDEARATWPESHVKIDG